VPRPRAAAAAMTAALLLSACTDSGGDKSDGEKPEPSRPPRVSDGVEVVVGGPDAVLRGNDDVLGPTETLEQYKWDYFAYPAQPPDPAARDLIRSDGGFSWSRETKPDVRAPQTQGTVVLAVLAVERSGGRATVRYCEDHSQLVSFPAGKLASPSPEPDRVPTAVHTLQWVRTTEPAVDDNQPSASPRWLATDAGLVGPDPKCAAAVRAVRPK
jgi:hypothetical protein